MSRLPIHQLAVLVLCSLTAVADAQVVVDSEVIIDGVVTTGVTRPLPFVFLNAREMLIGEKDSGRVKYIRNGVVAGDVLDLTVQGGGERGLLGMALHPQFPASPYVYIFYSATATKNGTWIENRVSRFEWDGAALVNGTRIYGFPNDPQQANGGNHNGGMVVFGPDGKLYISTGDLNRSRLEQNANPTTVAGVGGLYRINDDGTIPEDNPFASHADDRICALYSYGVRNCFGLNFDPVSGYLWMTDNGPSSFDEINLAFAGWNGGWRITMGPIPAGQEDSLVLLPGAEYSDPEFSFRNPVAITAIAFLAHSRFPCSYWNSAIVGNGFGTLSKLELNGARDAFVLEGLLADLVADNSTEANLVRWGTNWGTTGDLEIGPDGALYQSSLYANRLNRLRPRAGLGDLNCDGVLNTYDIDPFVLALTDAVAYAAAHPDCAVGLADMDCDGDIGGGDIEVFVEWMSDQ